MNGDEILQSVKAKGLSFTDIANALGVTPASVSNVARRKGSSVRIAKALAFAIKKPVEKVFPDQPQYHKNPISQADRQQQIKTIQDHLKQAGYPLQQRPAANA